MRLAILDYWRSNGDLRVGLPGAVAAALVVLALLRLIGDAEAAAANEGRKLEARVTVIALPLILDGRSLGEVRSRVSAEMDLLGVEARSAVELLRPILLPDVIKKLAQAAGPDGYIELPGFEQAGIGAAFDAGRLEVDLTIPGALRALFEFSLVPRRYGEGLRFLDPALLSSYVNLNGGFSYVHHSDSADGGRTPLILDFDGVLNGEGTALQGLLTWREENSHPWRRDGFSIVHDYPDRRTRLSVGDVVPAVDGFQSSALAGGISVVRNFNLQPYRRSSPAGQAEFELERNSRVDFLVNGQRVSTQRLGPGRYRVRDFPFAVGSNDVVVRITDEVGRVQTIQVPFVFDVSVLAAGEEDFGYTVGVTSERHSAGRRYNHADQLFSVFHNLGVTDWFTLGINGQGTSEVAQGGLEGRLATAIGTFRADLSGSRVVDGDRALAARLQYRYEEPPMARRYGRSGTVALTYRGARFASLGTTDPRNPVALDARLVYGQRLWEDISGNVGLTRQWARDEGDDGTQIDVGLSRRLGPEFSAQVVVSRRVGFGIKNDSRIFLSLSWFPLRSPHSFAASYDTSFDTSRLDWRYSPPDTVDSFQANASVTQDPDTKFMQGDLHYRGYRFESGVFHGVTSGRNGLAASDRRSDVTFGTALAYADGHVGVSRPIVDSFAMIVPHRTLEGRTIAANMRNGTPEAATDLLGPAVLPNLTSYYIHPVLIDAPDLPLGYDLGDEIFSVRPTFRSGTAIVVGTGGVAFIDAVLRDIEGEPLPLEPGVLIALDEPARAPFEFFTSRSGRLRRGGLPTGRYRMELLNFPGVTPEFAIPEGTEGRYDLGTFDLPVKVPSAQRRQPSE